METQVSKWGNSLGIRIPAAFARELGLKDGTTLDLSLVGERLIARKPREETLAEMVARITPENRHEAVDWGDPVGKEVW